MPHMIMRPKSVRRGNTAARTAPPTFSKRNVDAVWAGCVKLAVEIATAMIDAGVEAEVVGYRIGICRRAAGDADDAGAIALGELPGYCPDRARRRRDDDGPRRLSAGRSS